MNQDSNAKKHSGPRLRRRRASILLISLLLVLVAAVGGTLAYLFTDDDPIDNRFTPSRVGAMVSENFNGTTKSNVNVQNTGDTDAYVRVKLVTYRVNDQGERIGGTAQIPTFTPGTDWVLYDDGFYYFTKSVAAGETPPSALIDSMILVDNYADSDGGKQVIEVMAEAIQALGKDSEGKTPSQLAWGVTIASGNVTPYP